MIPALALLAPSVAAFFSVVFTVFASALPMSAIMLTSGGTGGGLDGAGGSDGLAPGASFFALSREAANLGGGPMLTGGAFTTGNPTLAWPASERWGTPAPAWPASVLVSGCLIRTSKESGSQTNRSMSRGASFARC